MADGASWVNAALTLLLSVLLGHFLLNLRRETTAATLLEDVDTNQDLKEAMQNHGQKRITKVTDGLYVATGFSMGNSILIEGPGGLVIVDTTESLEAGRLIYAAFRNISRAPIKAIVYTHHHADHIYGAKAFLNDNNTLPEVWAHHSFMEQQQRTTSMANVHFARAMRQFGPLLPDELKGGLNLMLDSNTPELGDIMPTHLAYGDVTNVSIAGLDVQLLHLPGETVDHLGVWIPSMRALLCGDNIYQAFPNLYAVRGTAPRDTLTWVRSLDKMRRLRAHHLVPSHTAPVAGVQEIYQLLTNYRDAIQFVHDQSVRYINKGFYPDDIVGRVRLPQGLRQHPYLQELYGTVEWSVKGVYDSYLGWFSGNIVDLHPLDTKEKAQRMIHLAGGVGSLAAAAQAALHKGDYRWALELASHIFHLNPNHVHSRQIRLEALKALASKQTSANGRNYYLTTALEDHQLVATTIPANIKKSAMNSASMSTLFNALALRLKAEETEGQRMTLVFNFTDIKMPYTVHLRNSILEVERGNTDSWDVKISTKSNVWRSLLAKQLNPLKAYLSGALVIDGGVLTFRQFMAYVEQD